MAENRHRGTFVNCEFLNIGQCLARSAKVHGCQAQCVLVVGQSMRGKCASRFLANAMRSDQEPAATGPNHVSCPTWAWHWPDCSNGCCGRAQAKPHLAMTCGSSRFRLARGLTA